MESEEEAVRLDLKTDRLVVEEQALWAGMKAGMRIADVCCGSGKTTAILHEFSQPGGTILGLDGSQQRIDYAKSHYKNPSIEFVCRDIRDPFDDLGTFDFVWVRFVIEYHRKDSTRLVEQISHIVKPGGILCLIDLDHNCMSHWGVPKRLEKTLFELMAVLEQSADFDPYAGRKLYSYLYQLGYSEIHANVQAHHLIYGSLKDLDAYNWTKKIEKASKKVRFPFTGYEGGYEEFLSEFMQFFSDPSRFSYTPVISVRGEKPLRYS
jgi:SAM-dependent methyltransferase